MLIYKFVVGTVLLGASLIIEPLLLHAEETIEGKLVADHVGRVSSEITGERSIRVQDLLVREGDRVRKGDVLARLSAEQLTADRAVAFGTFGEAEALVGVAKSRLELAKLTYNRQVGLKGSPSFRRATFEDAEVALRAAKSELKSAESSARSRKAEVERIELEIRRATIVAPYDGIVFKILTNVGASVTQKSPDLLELLDLTRVEIEVEIPSRDVSVFPIGRNVFYAYDGSDKYPAKVRAILPTLNDENRNRVMRLQVSAENIPLTFYNQQPVKIFLVN